MIRITKQELDAQRTSGVKAHHYDVAEQRVVFQEPVESLAKFERGQASEYFSQSMLRAQNLMLLDENNAELNYVGRAPFENKIQDVCCWGLNSIRQIDISGVPICQVDLRENHIHLLNDRSFDEQINLEVVTGPALILLLARARTYCLHAGAVATPYGNVAFIAESGFGKSTLSAHADEQWRQLSDDILPMRLFDDEKPMLLDFPQLKLAGGRATERIGVDAKLDLLIRLNNLPAEQPTFTPMTRTESLLQIVRHTVAAKLFDHKQMTRHSRFAKLLSAQVPMIELNYPRDVTKLSALRRSIIDYIQTAG